MSTLSDLLAARDTAGARYAAAIAELRDSYVDLAAIDLTLMNRRVGLSAAQMPVQTFHGFPQSLAQEFRHPIYALNIHESQNLQARAEAAAAVKLAAF